MASNSGFLGLAGWNRLTTVLADRRLTGPHEPLDAIQPVVQGTGQLDMNLLDFQQLHCLDNAPHTAHCTLRVQQFLGEGGPAEHTRTGFHDSPQYWLRQDTTWDHYAIIG